MLNVISRRDFLSDLLKGTIFLGGVCSGITAFPDKVLADKLLSLNDDLEPASLAELPFVYPFNRKAFSIDLWGNTNPFGNRDHGIVENSHHTGEDWLFEKQSAKTSGKPFYSINNGIVIYAGNYPDKPKLGQLVIIKHRVNLSEICDIPAFNYNKDSIVVDRKTYSSIFVYSYYLHLKKAEVKQGDNIRKGTEIGKAYLKSEYTGGSYSYVPHLHFEIWSMVKVNEDDNFNDSQGYDPPGNKTHQFGYSINKLVEGKAFIDENNLRPLILGMPRQTSEGLVISVC